MASENNNFDKLKENPNITEISAQETVTTTGENNNFDKLTENSDMITQITEQDESAIGGGSWAGFKEKAKNAGRKVKEFFTGTSSETGAGATMNAEAPQPTVVETPETVTEEVPAESAVTALVPQADTPKTKNLPGNRRRR